jgi:hypothetical protein
VVSVGGYLAKIDLIYLVRVLGEQAQPDVGDDVGPAPGSLHGAGPGKGRHSPADAVTEPRLA